MKSFLSVKGFELLWKSYKILQSGGYPDFTKMEFSKIDSLVIFLDVFFVEVFNDNFLLERDLAECLHSSVPLNPKDLLTLLYQWLVGIINVALIRQLVKHIKNARLCPDQRFL